MDFGGGFPGTFQKPKGQENMKYRIRYTPTAQKDMDAIERFSSILFYTFPTFHLALFTVII